MIWLPNLNEAARSHFKTGGSMDRNTDEILLTIESGTIVKIDGATKQLNTRLMIKIPVGFLDGQDILDAED